MNWPCTAQRCYAFLEMKPVPLARLLTYAAVFGGGVLAQRFLSPPAAASGPASKPVETLILPSQSAASVKAAGAFDGTVDGLLRMAKAARSAVRAQLQLSLVLQPLPAVRVGELAASFPRHPDLQWHEVAVRSALLQDWAEKDAAAALRWAGRLPKSSAGSVRLEILRYLAAADLKEALAIARSISSTDERMATLAELVPVIAETDPEEALRLLQSSGRERGDGRYGIIFRAWALRDPVEAWQKAQSLPLPSRSMACQEVLRVRAARDPGEALALTLTLQKGRSRLEGLGSVFSTWAARDPAKARDAALSLTSGAERDAAVQSVIPQWALDDPSSALRAAEALPKGAMRQQVLAQVYQTWAAQDPNGAAVSIKDSSMTAPQKAGCNANVAQTWAREDSSAAMQWAKGLPAREGQSYAMQCVLSTLAAGDGRAALAAWQSLPVDLQRTNLPSLVSAWASTDVDGALAFARSLEKPQEKIRALSSCASSVGFGNPEALTALINEIPEGPMRIMTIKSMAGDPFGNRPEGIMPWLRTLPERDRTAVLRDSNIDWCSGADPAELKAILAETPGLADRAHLWMGTAAAIASEDPAAALTWAQSIESPLARRESVQEALRTWAQNDPAAAMNQARTLTDAELQKYCLHSIIENWSEQDPDAVLAWAGTASGEEREFALLRGSLKRSGSDPAASAAVLSSLINDHTGDKTPSSLAYAAAEVALSWFRQDAQAGTNWVAQLPEGNARENAMSTVVTDWTRFDPISASAWVQQLPAGGSRDAAAASLSEGIRYSDPESAFTWALSISDVDKRDQSVRAAAEAWRWQDKAAALAAITRASIPESMRTSLVAKIEKQD
jgi:hypothetical protein